MAGVFGHRATGIGAAMVSYAYGYHAGFDSAPIMALFAFSGSSAPDWLEIPSPKKGWFGQLKRDSHGNMIRTSVIPHRTITHYLPAWVFLLYYAFSNLSAGMAWELAFAFAVGGLTHVLVDMPNPMGVPIFSPFHRYRLGAKFSRKKAGNEFGWWKSGEHDVLIAAIYIGIGYFSLRASGAI